MFRFGVFELDTGSGELRRHGLKIRLPEQSFQILKVLLSRPGEVVTREELQRVLWTSDTFVDFEVGLNSAVRKLREALDDSAENPRFIETLPRRGYRFIATVTAPAEESTATSDPAQVAEDVAVPSAASAPRSRVVIWSAAALVVVAVVAAAGVVYQRGGFEALRAGPATEPIRSLVVLPFENLTGDAGQDYFVDSVSDALTSHLARVPSLDVISRTTARQLKRSDKHVRQIGNELQVEGVLEGSVVRSGAGVRITAQLIRTATDRHVWAQTYESDLSHMIALQQRIAAEVAVAAGRPVPRAAGARTAKVINPRAYDAYLKGLTARGLQRHDGFRTAVGYFEEAVAIQPDFAEAYAALALTQVQFLYGGPLSPHETIPKAEAAARKALQLDDTLADAHRALGQIFSLYYWRWDEGDKAFQRAASAGGREELSEAGVGSLIRRGRFEEAVAAAERGRKLDPLSLNAQMAVGTAYGAARQYDRAINELRRALEMSPGRNRVHFQLGVTFLAMGRLDDAIRELEAAARTPQGHNSRMEAYLGYAYAAAGRTHDARKVLNELESHRRDQYVSSFGIALIHDALGEKEPALAALQRAYEDRAVEFALMAQYPPFKTIATDPRFEAVMRQVGLPRSGT
jgi:TolB-like protein/DNA-binding winged helix-turn-helix (wHTH) protein/tetratricopeptide (TPR) repeat protein